MYEFISYNHCYHIDERSLQFYYQSMYLLQIRLRGDVHIKSIDRTFRVAMVNWLDTYNLRQSFVKMHLAIVWILNFCLAWYILSIYNLKTLKHHCIVAAFIIIKINKRS